MAQQKKGRYLRSIKVQMLVIILFIVISLTMGILASVNIILSNKYDDEINFNNETVTNLISSNLENFLGKAYSITEELTQNNDVISFNASRQEPSLVSCAERNEFVELLFVQGVDGMQTARSSGECGERGDRWWFSSVTEDGKSFLSKSYLSASSNLPVSTVFMPLKRDGKTVGSIGMDIKLDYIQQLIDKNSDETSGRYSFIMDGEGVIVAHPDQGFVEKMYNYAKGCQTVNEKEEALDVSEYYKNVTAKAMAGESGSTYFKEDGKGYYCAYAPITLPGDSDPWSIITIQDETTAKSIISDIIRTSTIVGGVLLVAAVIIIILLANSIANPIKKISGLFTKAASGDFTVRFHTRSKSEIGVLSDSFNEMLEKVSVLLSSAKQITGDISESIVLLNTKSGNATEVAVNIKNAADDIQKGSMEQAVDVEKSAAMSSGLNEQFAALSQKTTDMVEEAANASDVTVSGKESVEELREKNQVTYDIIEKTAVVIHNLSEESEVIGSILKTLDDISSQTNLLSLNASIEAARAGEHGKSFAVVAEEIQKLSVESAQATENINQIIETIQSEIDSSVTMMEKIKLVSKEQNEAVKNVMGTFDKITGTTGSMVDFIEENEKLVIQMQQNNDQIVSSITNIAAISEETAACTENVTTSIGSQTAEIQDIAAQAEELKEKVTILDQEIRKFRI